VKNGRLLGASIAMNNIMIAAGDAFFEDPN
jgi:hypothetical protein